LSIVVEKDVAATAAALRRLSEEKAGSVSQVFDAMRKDGTIIELEMQGVPATYSGRPAIIGMIREISGKKRGAKPAP